MKKISIRFNTSPKVQKLKRILKKIHDKTNDQIKGIAKFTLSKHIIPQNVDHAELEIFTKDSREVITLTKESLSFMSGGEVLAKVSCTSDTEGQYIVLPWNLNSQTGKDALRELISKISSKTRAIKYTIYVNNPKPSTNITNVGIDDFSESENSITQLELSELSYGGHMEELLDKIELLERDVIKSNYIINEHETLLKHRENRISDLSSEIAGLNNQVNQKQGQINNLTGQLNQKDSEITGLRSNIEQKNSSLNSYSDQVNGYSSELYKLREKVKRMEPVFNKTPYNRVYLGGRVYYYGSASQGLVIIRKDSSTQRVEIEFDFIARTLDIKALYSCQDSREIRI